MEGKPIPSWFRAAGGVAGVAPGQTASSTQRLPAGTYYAMDTGSPEGEDGGEPYVARGAIAKIDVRADGNDGQLPRADATVTARDYSFQASGLRAGTARVRFRNAGKEPHHLLAVPMRPGATIAEVREFAREENSRGEPPVDFRRESGTVVLDGGTEQVVDLKLGKGKYALLCFITDRAGGPPHVAKGMVSEATVR